MYDTENSLNDILNLVELEMEQELNNDSNDTHTTQLWFNRLFGRASLDVIRLWNYVSWF